MEVQPAQFLVLVVDDDDAIRGLIAATLRGEDYAVAEARDGSEGLEALRAQRPHLVVLDLQMPVLNGHGFIEACRSDPSHADDAPIVIISATPSLPEQPDGTNVRTVLVKPFDIGVLLALVERLSRTAGAAASVA